MSTSETTASDLQQIAVDRLSADLRRLDPAIAQGATFEHTEVENPAGVPMVLTSVNLSAPITAKPSLAEARRSVKRVRQTQDLANRKAREAVDRADGRDVTIEQQQVSNPEGVAMVATFSKVEAVESKPAPPDTHVPIDTPITAAPARDQGRANRQRGKTSPTTGSRRSSTTSDGDRGDPDPADLADDVLGVAQ